MARVMKPNVDGFNETNTGSSFNDGPPPVRGVYRGKVKQLALATIASGNNAGGQRLHLVVEITEGKFQGAGLVTSLNLTQQGSPYVNQFLRSLTDGSDAQFQAIREAFWHTGYTVGDEDQKGRLPITKIGKKTNPIGLPTSFVTRMRAGNDGVERADITRFVVPTTVEPQEDSEPDLMDDFAELEGDSSDKVTIDVDSDDPWSV